MSFDWQTAVSLCIVAVAAVMVGRRCWRLLNPSAQSARGCDGCNSAPTGGSAGRVLPIVELNHLDSDRQITNAQPREQGP